MTTIKKLNWLKQQARKIGYITDPIEGFTIFKSFYSKEKLFLLNESGKVIEIIICFILGMMQARFHEMSKFFFIEATAELDLKQIDFMLNNIPFQIKFGFDKSRIEAERDVLNKQNIKVVNIPNCKKDNDNDIIDAICEILVLSGFSHDEIEEVIDNDPSLDIAYEIWQWYCKGLY